MLRVGLTGDLGSGKSTVARMLAARGAMVFSSDEMGRNMMQRGEPVYAAIIARFGPGVVRMDGSLDRRELARLAFGDGTSPARVEELNAIVHPAVLTEQARLIAELAKTQPDAIVVVESALIFSTTHAGSSGWQQRFDCVVQVTAPHALKVARFIERASAGRVVEIPERSAIEAEAVRRLAAQGSGEAHEADCLVIHNDGSLQHLEQQVDRVWHELRDRQQATKSAKS